MIIVALFGGLGNQMFQYAAAKSVALKLNVELKVDLTYLNDKNHLNSITKREFDLRNFNIDQNIASNVEIRRFVPDLWNCTRYDKLKYILYRKITNKNFYKERNPFRYESKFENIKDDTYMYGHFLTEKYFTKYRNVILELFKPKKIDSHNLKLINEIRKSNSVSVHIRRGDYLGSIYDLPEITEYYLNAIEFIKLRINNPRFYFFSDDMEFVNIHFKDYDINKKFISFNKDKNSFMDIILMNNCMHNICANSSFSWWGAWLNQNNNKIVIVPKRWFNNQQTTDELIPDNWIKL